MKTFRVEFKPDGTLDSCLELDRALPDGVLVFYVRADHAAAAVAKAERLRQRSRQRERRAQYRRQGLCPYDGRTLMPGMAKCELCVVKERIRQKGGNPSAPKGPQQLDARHKILVAERASVLLEVDRAWKNADTPAAFLRWLRYQLAAVLPGAEKAA